MKYLIVNGDDFGSSAQVNAGILQSNRQGILTSTSLMVTGDACVAAVAAARERPQLDVGLHVVLCQGRSVLPASQLDSLVDQRAAFTDHPIAAGLRYFFSRRLRAKLEQECRAQIESHLSAVGYLNHIDGHLNIHMHPTVLDILVDLAIEYHVPYIRLSREALFTTLALSPDHAARKIIEAVIFRSLSAHARRKMDERGIKSADWVFGLHQSGNITERYLRGILSRLPDKCAIELYLHPAAGIGGDARHAAAQREVDLLTNPEIRAVIERNNIRLTTYGELARPGQQAFTSAPQRGNSAGKPSTG